MLASGSVYLFYLVWRATHNINMANAWVACWALAFYVAEAHGFFGMLFHYFQVWSPTERVPPPAPPGLKVDVFILTYNEDPELLRKTILGAINMRYPHRTFVLDDGHRGNVRKLAEGLGAVYITRSDNANAKTGNFNHAFKQTDGTFIATFDADHVPLPNFLERTLGYFEDPKVCLVQTPQLFYNVDSVQFAADVKKRRIWHEQEVFFHLVQPGKDHWNAAFFCGTNAVIRREALKEWSGLVVGGITEDMETSILLHAKGWRTIYHHEVLSYGLAAADIAAYHKQRLRWAEGNLRIMRAHNPLTIKGLTAAQRICYFSSIFHWTTGFQKMVFYVTPPIMLMTGLYPIAPFTVAFLEIYFLWLGTVILGFYIVSRGRGRLIEEEVYNMVNFVTLIRAVVRTFNPVPPRFWVTPKSGATKVDYKEIYPHIFLVLLSYVAVLWTGLKWYVGMELDYLGVLIGVFWVLWNCYLVVRAIRVAVETQTRRSNFRFRDYIPVRYRSVRDDGKVFAGVGLTNDFNDGGLSLVTYEHLPVTDRIDLTLYLSNTSLTVSGETLRAETSTATGRNRQVFNYGVRFRNLTSTQADVLAQHAFHNSVPRFFAKFVESAPLLIRVAGYLMRHGLYKRSFPRRRVNLPLIVGTSKTDLSYLVTTDMSVTGAALEVPRPLPWRTMSMTILSPVGTLDVRGKVVREQEKRHGGAVAWHYGIKFEDPTGDVRTALGGIFEAMKAA